MTEPLLPHPPTANELAQVGIRENEQLILPVDPPWSRIHFTASEHPTPWNKLRHYGRPPHSHASTRSGNV